MDTLKAMQVFRRVVEAGSFSAVAREHGMAQSSVSKHVAALEERLGSKLMNRSTRQLRLTDDGQQYYRHCRRILDELDEAEAELGRGTNDVKGSLRVTAAVPFGRDFIIPFLPAFLERHPGLSVDLLLDDRYVDLLKEGVDLAIRVGPLADSNLIARHLGQSPRVLLASPDYLERHGEPQHPKDLVDHDCLIHSLMDTPTVWHFMDAGKPMAVKVDGRVRVSSPDALGSATRAGLGLSVMCRWAVEDAIESGELKVIMPGYPPPPFEVSAVYPDRQFVPARVRLLIEHLKAAFGVGGEPGVDRADG